jgi:hypothetical protein
MTFEFSCRHKATPSRNTDMHGLTRTITDKLRRLSRPWQSVYVRVRPCLVLYPSGNTRDSTRAQFSPIIAAISSGV